MRAATDVRERRERNSRFVRGWALLWVALAAIGVAFLVGGVGSPRAGGSASAGGIAFERNTDRPDESATVWTARLDGSDRRRLTDRRTSFSSDPAWSPDGRQIVYGRISIGESEIDRGIWVMNANGSNQHALTSTKGLAHGSACEEAADTEPAWSPNGRTIAFTRFRPEYGAYAIWLMNRDGSNQRQLTRKPLSAGQPAWSPSGTRLAFTAFQKDDSYLFTIRTDGSGLRRLATRSRGVVSWSPDGRTLAFEGRAGDIRLLDLRNGRNRRLIADANSPSWLANGRSLLISRARTFYVDSIYLISKHGGKPHFITDGENPSQQPTQPKTNR